MTQIIKRSHLNYARGHCGNIKEMIPDNKNISFVYLKVDKAREHYHKITTEFYYVLSGNGKVKLNDEVHDVSEGDLVEISPMTKHKAFDEDGLKILVIMSPPLSPSDNHFVD